MGEHLLEAEQPLLVRRSLRLKRVNQSGDEEEEVTSSDISVPTRIGRRAMDATSTGTDPRDLEGFRLFFWLAQGLGVIAIVLVGIWTSQYRGGFAWSSNPKLEFNWHPLLMTIGMIFLYANGIMMFRNMRYTRKKQLKLLHAGCHVLTFVLTVIALVAVFDSHNLAVPPIPNLYTLHSWIGLTAVIMFCAQFVAGFVTFLAPGAKQSIRAALMPVHRYFGMLGLVLAIAASLMGLLEKAIWTVTDYQDLQGEGILVNFIGVFLVLFGAVVIYVVSNFGYRRVAMAEDEMLLSTGSQMD